MSAAAAANSWDSNQLYSSAAADLLNICLGGAPIKLRTQCGLDIVCTTRRCYKMHNVSIKKCRGYKTLKLNKVATLLLYNVNGTKYQLMTIQWTPNIVDRCTQLYWLLYFWILVQCTYTICTTMIHVQQSLYPEVIPNLFLQWPRWSRGTCRPPSSTPTITSRGCTAAVTSTRTTPPPSTTSQLTGPLPTPGSMHR